MGRNLSNHSDSPVGDRGGSPRRRSSSRKSPSSRAERSPPWHRRSQRDRDRDRDASPPREKKSSITKSPKHARSPSPPARSPSPRSKRLRRAQDAREAERESERSNGRGTDRDLHKEGGSEKERRSGRDDTEGKSSRSRHGTSPSDRQRRSRHRSPSPQPGGDTRGEERVIDQEQERNHSRGSDRSMQREKGSDRENEGERVDKRSRKDSTDLRSSRSRHEQSSSPSSDRHHKNKHRSHSPQQVANARVRDEVPSPREEEHRDDENDAVAMMKAAEEALEAKQKQKPSFELSGKLAEETNRVRGITLIFTEPPEARKPDVRWRLYVFKGGEVLSDPLYIHRQSCYLFGRERRVADIPTDHPSCSKQHAVIQFRQVEKEQPDGMLSKEVRPYLMDLGSTNKTFLNETAIEPQRYYELMEKDTIKFGNSSREYVLLHENSMD